MIASRQSGREIHTTTRVVGDGPEQEFGSKRDAFEEARPEGVLE